MGVENIKVEQNQGYNGPPLEFRLDAPFSVLNGNYAETQRMTVTDIASAYYIADLFLKSSVYDAAPNGLLGRLAGIWARLLLQVPTVFLNHEIGHTKIAPLAGEKNEPYNSPTSLSELMTYSGGLENSMLFANKALDDSSMWGPNYSSALMYMTLKFDNFMQYTMQGVQVSTGDIVGCSSGNCDPYVMKKYIASRRTGKSVDEIDEGSENFDRYAGYSDEVNTLGFLAHMYDPVMFWSMYQVVAGDGSPPPFGVPQFHYLLTPYGPTFFIRERIALERDSFTDAASVLMSVSAFITVNNYASQSFGGEAGFREVPLPFLKTRLDAAFAMSNSPMDGFSADVEGKLKFPVAGGDMTINGGMDHKFGKGYIPGARSAPGPAIILGFTLIIR